IGCATSDPRYSDVGPGKERRTAAPGWRAAPGDTARARPTGPAERWPLGWVRRRTGRRLHHMLSQRQERPASEGMCPWRPSNSSAHARSSTLEATPPVSYTHLRAHETVLDLVCRLLLEKKK